MTLIKINLRKLEEFSFFELHGGQITIPERLTNLKGLQKKIIFKIAKFEEGK